MLNNIYFESMYNSTNYYEFFSISLFKLLIFRFIYLLLLLLLLFFHISHKLPNSLTAKEITRQLNNYHAQIVTRNKSSQSTIKTFSLSSTNTNISKRHSRTPLLRRNVESIRRHRWILFSKNHKLLAKYLPLSRAVFYDVVRSFRDI